MKYPAKHYIEYILLVMATAFIRVLPLRIALLTGWIFAALLHFIFQFRRKEAMRRIKEVYQGKFSNKKIRYIAWVSWRNLCFNIIEMMRYQKLNAEILRESDIGQDLLKLKAQLGEKGLVAPTIHMGNWELSAVSMDLLGLPICSIARRQKNKLTDRFINQNRMKFNLDMSYSDDLSLKKIVRKIQDGHVFVILPDVRNPYPAQKIKFLNGEANLGMGAIAFAYNCKCPITPFIFKRIGWSRHEVTWLPVIYPDYNIEKDTDQKRMLMKLMRIFNDEIDNHPEQYFWYNKRWVLDPLKNN